MPRGDHSGPLGMGPMTGRGAGYCAGMEGPGSTNAEPGRSFGMNWRRGQGFGGRGRGRRYRFHANDWRCRQLVGERAAPLRNLDVDMERQALKQKADRLDAELELVRKRLDEITNGLDER